MIRLLGLLFRTPSYMGGGSIRAALRIIKTVAYMQA